MTASATTSPRQPAQRGPEIKTLRQARRDFFRRPSPYVIGAGIVALVVTRVAIGDPTWRDAIAVGVMLAVYPFGEWAIHVYLLHMPKFRFRGREVEALPARNHREHHEAPDDLSQLLLEPRELGALLLGSVPFTVGLLTGLVTLAVGSPPIGAVVSAALTGYCCVFVYEWTHFLIHTAVRPRSRFYRQVWRNHRLHHFKNEHYWHGITQNWSDRILGTNPDQSEVPRSKTARTLSR
jgi:hypothetical protein